MTNSSSRNQGPDDRRDAELSGIAADLANRPYARRGAPQSDEILRVLLVDDHVIFRQGLKSLLRGVPDITVVGEAANGPEALELIPRLRPNVVVMDLDMKGGDGATATRSIARLEDAPRVLILTMHQERERLVPLLQVGASGFLSKEAADSELVDAIRVVASGEVYVRPQVARMLAASIRPDTKRETEGVREQYASLSDREQAVLRHVAEGYSGPEIGKMLGITAKTVDTYKQRIEEKLGLRHRSDYVRFAVAVGLLA